MARTTSLRPLFVTLTTITMSVASLTLVGCAHSTPITAKTDSSRAPARVQSGYAPVNGLKMYYEVHGEGSPLVLIHGGGGTIEGGFARILPLLTAQHRRIIAIEEQGHGHTAAIDRPFNFENSADDVAGVLDYLKIAQADVFGFSNGGSIAMRLATRHPAKVRRLIVASTMYRRDGLPKGFWEGMKHAKLSDMPKALQDADRKLNPDPKHLEQLFKQDSQRMNAFRDWPDQDLRSITAPTLILTGDQDIILPEHALKMSRLIPKARLTILPANHGNYLGEVAAPQPSEHLLQATAAIIAEFLN